MKLYVFSLGAGLLVGIVYSLLSVRSPAPPLIALIGLLGILVGEQIIAMGKQWLDGPAISADHDSAQASAQANAVLPEVLPAGQDDQPSHNKTFM